MAFQLNTNCDYHFESILKIFVIAIIFGLLQKRLQSYIIWTVSNGPYHMDRIIWTVSKPRLHPYLNPSMTEIAIICVPPIFCTN